MWAERSVLSIQSKIRASPVARTRLVCWKARPDPWMSWALHSGVISQAPSDWVVCVSIADMSSCIVHASANWQTKWVTSQQLSPQFCYWQTYVKQRRQAVNLRTKKRPWVIRSVPRLTMEINLIKKLMIVVLKVRVRLLHAPLLAE